MGLISKLKEKKQVEQLMTDMLFEMLEEQFLTNDTSITYANAWDFKPSYELPQNFQCGGVDNSGKFLKVDSDGYIRPTAVEPGTGVTQEYVDGQDQRILQTAKNYTDDETDRATEEEERLEGLIEALDATKAGIDYISVSASGSSTNEVSYITIGNTEYKLAGGSGGTVYWSNLNKSPTDTTKIQTELDNRIKVSSDTAQVLDTNLQFDTMVPIARDVDNSSLSISGGKDSSSGLITAIGKNATQNAGGVMLIPNNGNDYSLFTGLPNGNWLLEGQSFTIKQDTPNLSLKTNSENNSARSDIYFKNSGDTVYAGLRANLDGALQIARKATNGANWWNGANVIFQNNGNLELVGTNEAGGAVSSSIKLTGDGVNVSNNLTVMNNEVLTGIQKTAIRNFYAQGGNASTPGANLTLNYRGSNNGSFQLRANNGENICSLVGDANKNLTWEGKNVACETEKLNGTGAITLASGMSGISENFVTNVVGNMILVSGLVQTIAPGTTSGWVTIGTLNTTKSIYSVVTGCAMGYNTTMGFNAVPIQITTGKLLQYYYSPTQQGTAGITNLRINITALIS